MSPGFTLFLGGSIRVCLEPKGLRHFVGGERSVSRAPTRECLRTRCSPFCGVDCIAFVLFVFFSERFSSSVAASRGHVCSFCVVFLCVRAIVNILTLFHN